ncbi:MAG: DUF4375 domain-containing protein [Clostridia bacterium]|nr:DUF4375 domain-containing protein [Clostridia bacterium]
MGWLSLAVIKEMIGFRKALKRSIKEQKERESNYLRMSTEELAALSDDELFDAVLTRTEKIISDYEDIKDGFDAFNNEQRIFYGVSYLEAEVNNGGLCQFFVNSSRIVAPFVSGYMEIIGAAEHKNLYDAFIAKHRINVNELSSFDSETSEEFVAQYERYPFDDYDDAFYELEPLQNCLIPFIKKHIDKF